MNASNYDVVVVGAGAAGLTAAIGLARAGFAVAVVEAAAYPGAENWSGCVYFCENLAHPDILGPEGVEALAWERRLIERGFFASDGHGLLGMTYRDPNAFRHCYTVLRPIYDHHLAQAAQRHGVAVIAETTAESLIREAGRVVGICTTRGPLYADLVFLAEGDASHLVTREGYERSTDPRDAPTFLQGIKQIIELPPGAIEERFGVGAEEGVAYEMLLRNGTLNDRSMHLNMGGFVYTNRQSLSVGLVLPAGHLHQHFGGDPNLLIEWFENLPALRPWLRDGKRGVFGAKIIRGGGAKDIPTLIDDGLAIGGAASAIGIDFPFPNFTGPATAMGLLIAQAAGRIRAEGGTFTRDHLHRHYLEPLQRSHYWQDVAFLHRWPGYVKKTQVFFGRNLELVLGSAYIWTKPRRWFLGKWTDWLRWILSTTGSGQWRAQKADLRQLLRALRLREVIGRPGWGWLLLDGALNALRDLCRRPRAHLPPAGELRLHYAVAGGAEPAGAPPRFVRRWFGRFAPVLAAMAGRVYANDDTPLAAKLPGVVQLLLKQINLFNLLAAGALGLAAAMSAVLLVGWNGVLSRLRRRPPKTASLPARYARAAREASDLTTTLVPAGQQWESRLASLSYHTAKTSHIHLLWPRSLPEKDAIAQEGLWHVCPAHVYEAHVSPLGQLQVVVNFENCIKCETCWRTSDLIDWGRDGQHRFTYPVHSPSVTRLLASMESAVSTRPTLPRSLAARAASATEQTTREGRNCGGWNEARLLLDKLDRKLAELDAALAEEPRTIDRARADHLEMLARYAQQLAERVVEVLRASVSPSAPSPLMDLATALVAKAEERTRRTWDQRYSWAAADGRHMRQHHIAGLRRFLAEAEVPDTTSRAAWLTSAVARRDQVGGSPPTLAQRLDTVFGSTAWRDLERGVSLTPSQDSLLRELMAEVPAIDPANLSATLHPPARKKLLAELGRRDPSLAYRVASHLWARDLALLGGAALTEYAERWRAGKEWACFAELDSEAWFVPAGSADSLLLLIGDELAVLALKDPRQRAGLHLETLTTLGLRGAGLTRLRLEEPPAPTERAPVDRASVQHVGTVLCAADLISIAFGMADQLCMRAIAHATSRVQFPGLFHDEEARDPIGKFGAIKKMIAEMGARRYLIETIDCNQSFFQMHLSAASEARGWGEGDCEAARPLTPNPSPPSTGARGEEDKPLSPAAGEDKPLSPAAEERGWGEDAKRAGLLKALVAEALGTAPGSLSYNAGQIFGGTGYSEDDVLAKFYRDAAAWRFLPPSNSAVYQEYGDQLLRDGLEEELAAVASENVIFEEISQRKALQAELDELRGLETRLRKLVSDWREARPNSALENNSHEGMKAAENAEFTENLARQAVCLLAGRAILLRTHARMEDGLNAETETALLRVWLEDISKSLEEFTSRAHLWLEPALGQDDRPLVEPTAGPAIASYADYLAANCPYETGAFLADPIDLGQPRLVPEMVTADPALAAQDNHLRTLLSAQFGHTREGLLYERYIERQHRPDAADLDFCREHGFFRMPIPKDLGGEGRSKLEYYLLTTNAQRLADVGISLTIQVNSSLGTTPILLARDKDIPRARKDLAETEELHGELARRRDACDLFLRWIASGQISGFALTEPSAGSDTARVASRARLRSVPVEREADGILSFVPYGSSERRHLLDASRLQFHSDGVFYRWSDDAEPAPIRFDEYDYETDDPARMRYYDRGSRRVHFMDIAQVRERDGRLWYDYWELNGAKMWITNGRMAGVFCLYAKTEEGVTGFLVDRHAEGLIVGKDEAKLGQLGSPTNELSLQAVRVPRENVLGLEGRGQVNALETLNVGRAGLAMSAMAQMKGLIESSRAFVQGPTTPGWVSWRLQRMDEERFTAEALAFEVIGRFEHPQTKSVRMESAIAKMLVSEALHRVIELAEDIHGLAGQTQKHLVEKRKRDARVLTIYEGTNEIQRFLILKELAADVARRWPGRTPAPKHLSPRVLELEVLKASFRQRVEAALTLFGQKLWQNPNLQANCFLLAEATAWLKAADSTLGRLAWLHSNEDRGSRIEDSDHAVGDGPTSFAAGLRALSRCQNEVRLRLKRFDEELTHLRRGYYAPEIRAASLLFDHPVGSLPAKVPASDIKRPLSILVVVEPGVGSVPRPMVGDGRILEPHLVLGTGDRSALEIALRLREETTAPVTIHVAAVGPGRFALPLREALSLGADSIRLVTTQVDSVTPDCAAKALAAVVGRETAFDLVLGGSSGADQEEGLLGMLTARALNIPYVGEAVELAVRTFESGGEALLWGADGKRQRVRPLPAALTIGAGPPLRSFSTQGYLAGLSGKVQIIDWPPQLELRPAWISSESPDAARVAKEESPHPLHPDEAAHQVLAILGQSLTVGAPTKTFAELIEDVSLPVVADRAVIAVLATQADGRLQPTAMSVMNAARLLAASQAAEADGGNESPLSPLLGGERAGVTSLSTPATSLTPNPSPLKPGRGEILSCRLPDITALLLAPQSEEAQRRALAEVVELPCGNVVLLGMAESTVAVEIRSRLLAEALPALAARACCLVGEPWAESAFAQLSQPVKHADDCFKTGSGVLNSRTPGPVLKHAADVALRVQRLAREHGQLIAEVRRSNGKLRARRTLRPGPQRTCWITLAEGAEVEGFVPASEISRGRVQRWMPQLPGFFGRADIRRVLEEVKQETGLTRLADADFIIDVGFGVGNRDGYEAIIEPLETALRELGVRNVVVGGSRKVTEELHLLPADRQIGQSGVSVNPRVLLAIGVSGAPQHINYIGSRATILAFNRDPEAPLMTLNQRQPRPRVFPVVGDLFDTVPALTTALRQDRSGTESLPLQRADAGSLSHA